jgi:predicted DNA-binding protein YlxM (UPF0122 family)
MSRDLTPFQEIADELGVTHQAVIQCYNRAMAKLREAFADIDVTLLTDKTGTRIVLPQEDHVEEKAVKLIEKLFESGMTVEQLSALLKKGGK